MEILKLIENSEEDNKIVKKVAKVLESGGVVVFPTDTIYGLGANALNDEAVLKIYNIKKRSREKPISIFVRDVEMARKFACIDSRAEAILRKLWPGPITVILRKKDTISYILTSDEENVAIRIPDNYFIKKLFKEIDFPITATSANISGEESFLTVREIKEKFSESDIFPDMLIDAGDLSNLVPSTIIDLTEIKNPRIVRMGSVNEKEFKELFKKIMD